MSTLQHASELRGRTTRHLVLIVVIATIVLGGIVASIVAEGRRARACRPFSVRNVQLSRTREWR